MMKFIKILNMELFDKFNKVLRERGIYSIIEVDGKIKIVIDENFNEYLVLKYLISICSKYCDKIGIILDDLYIIEKYYSDLSENVEFISLTDELKNKKYDILFIFEVNNFDFSKLSDNIVIISTNENKFIDELLSFNEYSEPNWEKIKNKLGELVDILNKELGWFNKEELYNTPKRVAKFYKEWYEYSEWDDIRLFDNGNNEFGCSKVYDQLVVLSDISISSMCSHHMLPFIGKCHIAYLPYEKVVGVSKLARIVKKFASKPQIQEQLTSEISEFILNELKCKFVLVIIEAQHMCIKIRGAKENESKMITSDIKWNRELIDDDKIEGLKQESLKLIYK